MSYAFRTLFVYFLTFRAEQFQVIFFAAVAPAARAGVIYAAMGLARRLLPLSRRASIPLWRTQQASGISTVPMSRMEPDAFVDYDTMADKLKARPLARVLTRPVPHIASPSAPRADHPQAAQHAADAVGEGASRGAAAVGRTDSDVRAKEPKHGPTELLAHGERPQIVYSHLDDPETSGLERGVTYLKLRPGACPRANPRGRSALTPARGARAQTGWPCRTRPRRWLCCRRARVACNHLPRASHAAAAPVHVLRPAADGGAVHHPLRPLD